MKSVVQRFVRIVGWIVGADCAVRAVVESFLIDMSDPSTYRNDRAGRACWVSCSSTRCRA